jgi:hypothetical protein
VLVVALSASLQHLPYQDNEHNVIETLGIQACLLQLMVALLCNLVQDDGGQGGHNRLGPNSTAVLIFVVFGSTLAFFGMTVHATVHGSLETKGVVGKLAKGMVRCCCVGQKKGKDGQGAEDRPPSLARVVPVQPDGQEQQQKSRLKKEIAALKWQKKIRQTLMNNNKPSTTTGSPNRFKRKQTWRTQRAEEIQNAHQNHRALALKSIERQHSQRRSSLQLRVEARNKKKEKAVIKDKAAATSTLATANTEKRVERIRATLCNTIKKPALFQKFMTQHDKDCTGHLSRVCFAKLVRKMVKKIATGDVKEDFMEAIWVSMKKRGGEEVAWSAIEQEVAKQWVFLGVE